MQALARTKWWLGLVFLAYFTTEAVTNNVLPPGPMRQLLASFAHALTAWIALMWEQPRTAWTNDQRVQNGLQPIPSLVPRDASYQVTGLVPPRQDDVVTPAESPTAKK